MNTNRDFFCGIIFLLLLSISLSAAEVKRTSSPMRPANLTCEGRVNPIGIDTAVPRLSWNFTTDGAKLTDRHQTAYRILAASSDIGLLNESADAILWDSGWVESDQTCNIPYAGKPLESNKTYFWTVQTRDNRQGESKSGIIGTWSTALLDPKEWTAEWIGTGEDFLADGDGSSRPFDPWFRKTFKLTSRPKQAFLHIASVGFHELYVNGKKADDAVMVPAVSDHRHRARYVTYDITPYLETGTNAIGVWLGTGWSIYPDYASADRPNAPIFKAQTDIITSDGVTRIATDETWKCAQSGNKLLGSWKPGGFGGEYQDGDADSDSWSQALFNDNRWKNSVVCRPNLAVSAQSVETNRIVTLIAPVSVTQTKEGDWRVDMGRNFAGWTEIEVRGEPGDIVEFLYSESPHSDQTFNLFSRIKIGQSGRSVFKNRFNYSSARWITIRGLKEEPDINKIRGWLVRTDFQRASSFSCSDELQNWIYNTVLWTFENLSLGGYIVDCPQRERMGYGGDAHATCETGMLNFKMKAFYEKWMEDWRDVQGWHQDWLDDVDNINPGEAETALRGTLPNTAPTYFGGGGPAWGGIVVTLPWFCYQYYGDTKILSDNFELMERWLDFVNSYVQNGLLRRYGDQWNFLGDWLWPGAPNGPNSDKEDTLCLNNIYRVFNLRTAAKIAHVLGKTDQETEWLRLAEEGSEAINRTYFNQEDTSYFNGSPSIQAAALLAEIPTAEQRAAVQKRLEKEILENDNGHIGSGITGGALLFRYLRQEGRDDLIWSMASKTDYPGWGFMKENDATTIWEAWELDRPGHSLLHSSYLYIGSWYIDSVLGIRNNPSDVGYRKIVIHPPKFDDTGIEWARGDYDAPTGKIIVNWQKYPANRSFIMKVTIPVNTTATVYVPASDFTGTRGTNGAKWLYDEPGYSVYQVSSGYYEFKSRLGKKNQEEEEEEGVARTDGERTDEEVIRTE